MVAPYRHFNQTRNRAVADILAANDLTHRFAIAVALPDRLDAACLGALARKIGVVLHRMWIGSGAFSCP